MELAVYTDASVKDNFYSGGIFIIDYSDNEQEYRFHISKTSLRKGKGSQTAELKAIERAFSLIKNFPNNKVVLYTDLNSAFLKLNNLCKVRPTSKKDEHYRKLILMYEDLKKVKDIEIRWSPGHKGIYGNHMADRIAKFSLEGNKKMMKRYKYEKRF